MREGQKRRRRTDEEYNINTAHEERDDEVACETGHKHGDKTNHRQNGRQLKVILVVQL